MSLRDDFKMRPKAATGQPSFEGNLPVDGCQCPVGAGDRWHYVREKLFIKAATDLAFLIGGRWREAPDDGTRMRELLPAGSTETQMIRTAWIETEEEWYFSIQDVVAALTDSVDPK